MDNKEINVPVYTLIHSEESKNYKENDGQEEENVVFLTINESEEHEEIETTSYLLQNDGSVIQQFDASTVFNSSNGKILTLEDGRFLYVTTDEDENVQSIEPHLISSQNTEKNEIKKNEEMLESELKETDENEETTSEVGVIKIVEPYQMIMYNNLAQSDTVVPPKKSIKCVYKNCGKLYSTTQHLHVHLRNHANIKPYSCTFEGCEKNFSTNYSLKAHIRTHTGERPYPCTICGKPFKTSGDLQKHHRTHTGEKPFLCPIEGCGKSFTTSNIRKVHVRSHTGERPYICDYPNCGKAFSSSTNYKNHTRIHSGEKPYVCLVKGCDKRFTEYSSLHKHSIVHQTTRPFECDFCEQTFKSEQALTLHRKVRSCPPPV